MNDKARRVAAAVHKARIALAVPGTDGSTQVVEYVRADLYDRAKKRVGSLTESLRKTREKLHEAADAAQARVARDVSVNERAARLEKADAIAARALSVWRKAHGEPADAPPPRFEDLMDWLVERATP